MSRTSVIWTALLTVGVTATLLLLSACTGPGLARRTAGRYVVVRSGRAPEDAAALRRLADAHVDGVCEYLGLTTPTVPVEILLFPHSWNRRSYLREHCPRMADAGAACYRSDDGLVIALAEQWTEAETIRYLRHELTHFAIASHYRDIPPWLDEGLARFFELGPPWGEPHDAMLRSCRKQMDRADEPLLPGLVTIPYGERLTRKQYALAWGVTYYLLTHAEQGGACVRGYLTEVRYGDPLPARFTDSFGQPPEALDAEWREAMRELGR